jgi:putative chitinase
MAINRKVFFDGIRSSPFTGKLEKGQVEGVSAILDEWERRKLTDLRWLAYMLATAKWETGHTMQPIQERGGSAYLTRLYDVKGSRSSTARKNGNTTPGDGILYSGKGYVQLTWKNNYITMQKMLKAAGFGCDIVNDPSQAMQGDIAAFILFEGMVRGTFTGKNLSDYFNAKTNDPVNARRIINGTDCAVEIAAIHKQFYADLMFAA